jgi:spore coat protein U-like protein
MTPARLAFVVGCAGLLITLPAAGAVEQYPRGLMSAEPAASGKRTCLIDVRPVSFGSYDPLSGNAVSAVGQVIYVCGKLGATTTAQDNKAIRIEMTTGLANQSSPRHMGAGANEYLAYNLYLDPTHRTIWGQGAFGTDVYVDSHPPNRTPVVVPVYGQIFAAQDVYAGQYADTVTARIVF